MTSEGTIMTGQPVEMPDRIAALPRDRLGRPIPWFVASTGGEPDFRVASLPRQRDATRFDLCWVCGQHRGRHGSFAVGPMCAVNRISAEPPSHVECAVYSARVCPFLSTPGMVRRVRNLPAGHEPPAGGMLFRNPGVIAVWTSRAWRPFPALGGMLWNLGEPVTVAWYTQGRPATRMEVTVAIDAGLPALREVAERDGPVAVRELQGMLATALTLLPTETETDTVVQA